MAPAESPIPEARTTKGCSFMATHRILKNALTDEVKRMILRESLDRYRNELIDDEERQTLLGRIRRLRRQLQLEGGF